MNLVACWPTGTGPLCARIGVMDGVATAALTPTIPIAPMPLIANGFTVRPLRHHDYLDPTHIRIHGI